MAKLSCPVSSAHDEFVATHCEKVDHLFSADGEYIEDVKNTYEGAGYDGPLYCRDCDRIGVVTIIADDANDVID